MKILAADTSTSINTVAVCDDGRVLAEIIVECGRSHSERLIDTVDWVLAEAGLKIEDMDALAISVGPGSFTGVRVGVATWKGLALGARLPLTPVPTLDAMTRLGVFREGLVCPLLDARMREVFGAVYRFTNGRREKLTPDRVCPVDLLLDHIDTVCQQFVSVRQTVTNSLSPFDKLWTNCGDAIFLGNGAELYRERILERRPGAAFASAICSVPRASAVAAEARALIEQGVCTDAALVSPVYLRKSQAEMNRARREAAS
jgi:tRNA threonylcarbamoyladenosine biosynthesis protein TsaB